MIPAARVAAVPRLQKALAISLLVAGLIAIALLTLLPTAASDRISFWCVKCGERPGVDVLLNILLFVPFGVGLGLSGLRFPPALAAALLCTASVEALQFFAVAGRYASARDIVANTAGALLGYLAGRHWRSVLVPTPGVARGLLLAAFVAVLVIQGFTAWAMGAAYPGVQWWAQLRPEHDRYPSVFTGQITEIAIGAMPIRRSDRLDDTDRARELLSAGEALRVAVTGAPSNARMAPIAIISAGPVFDVARWIADARDGIFAATVRGTLIGLRTPSLRLADVVSGRETDTVAFSGSYHDGWYRLAAESAAGRRTRAVRASASWGWALLLPFPLYAFGGEVFALTALYLALVWIVLGYWSGRSAARSRPAPALAILIVGTLLALAVVPLAFRLPVSHWTEWLAALGAAAAGWAIARASVRVQSPRPA